MLAAPEVLHVGRRRPVPTFAILFVQGDLAQRRVDEPHQVLGDEGQGLVEVDGACDRLADIGHQLQLLGVALRLFVQACGFDRDRELTCCCAQGLDLPPVGSALVGTVIADFEDPGRPPRLIAAKRHEDPDQILVAPAFEHFAGQRERRVVRGISLLPLADKTREHLAQHHAVAVDDGDLDPRRLDRDPTRDHI